MESSTIPTLIAVLIGALALVTAVALRTRRRPTAESGLTDLQVASVNEVAVLRESLALPPGVDELFDVSASDVIRSGDTLVLPFPGMDDQAIVIGSRRDAARLGQVLGEVPRQLYGMAVGADALVKIGMAAGEQSGVLVRLTAESAKAMRSMNVTKDAAGQMLAVFRTTGGKFGHVARFAPANSLQVLSGVTGALSAIAMQAQLAAIEKAIAAVGEAVQRVEKKHDNAVAADRAGVESALQGLYQGAVAAGRMTQGTWDQVATLIHPAYTNRAYADLELERVLGELTPGHDATKRVAWLDQGPISLINALGAVNQAERSLTQFQSLRSWWLIVNGDATAQHFLQQYESDVLARDLRRAQISGRVTDLLEKSKETTLLRICQSPIHSRAARSKFPKLLEELQDKGLLDVIAYGRAIGSVNVPVRELTADP